MPTWFIILAKVLSMLSYLIPQVEQTFGASADSGPQKKEAVLTRVKEWLDSPQAAAADPELDHPRKEAIQAFAATAIDHIVEAANASDAFPQVDAAEPPDPDVSQHELEPQAQPWDLPRAGNPGHHRRR